MTKDDCSAEEWAARVQLAAAYRIFAMLGWTELIYNHISLRVPGETGCILMNPLGLPYTEVCASNLIKNDARGTLLDDSKWGLNPAGITFQGAIHETLSEAHCVMHVHTTATLGRAGRIFRLSTLGNQHEHCCY